MMGARIDQLGAGAALQVVAGLGVVLTVVFGGLFALFPRTGWLQSGGVVAGRLRRVSQVGISQRNCRMRSGHRCRLAR